MILQLTACAIDDASPVPGRRAVSTLNNDFFVGGDRDAFSFQFEIEFCEYVDAVLQRLDVNIAAGGDQRHPHFVGEKAHAVFSAG